jgi:hypothetical protein
MTWTSPAPVHHQEHHLECSEDLMLLADLPMKGGTYNCQDKFTTNGLPSPWKLGSLIFFFFLS